MDQLLVGTGNPRMGLRQRVSGVLVLLALVASTGAGTRVDGGTGDVPSRPVLSSKELREGLADPSKRPTHAVRDDPARARVEVFHRSRAAEALSAVQHLGGRVTGEVPGVLVQAEVRWEDLSHLERSPGVTSVRPQRRIRVVPRMDPPPLRRSPEGDAENRRRRGRRNKKTGGVGEEVSKINAGAWHAAGKLGGGVKVGIIDVFSRSSYKKAQRAKEVPAPAGTSCVSFGRRCDVFEVTPHVSHGTAVAEVVHEMAPDAQLVLGFADTTADLQAVVDDFIAQGVRIITRSLTSEYDGPGDGTGPVATVVNNAIKGGITWFNSSGNAGGIGTFPNSGAYYRGRFTDTDGDGLHEFEPGKELLGIPCFVFTLGLRWDDFDEPPTAVTDFDLVQFDRQGQILEETADRQGASGGAAPPIENFSRSLTSCEPRAAFNLVFIAFKRVAAGSDAGDTIEFQNNGAPMTFSTNPFSAAVPACDSANAGLVCVGAIDPPLGTQVAPYSSQGPTNDNRTKPDITAAACVTSFAFKGCFDGTSASTPAAAGAAALVLGAGIASASPADLANFLRAAVVDRGAPGPDNVYGAGELVLPPPPP